jgi:hypothetical protein
MEISLKALACNRRAHKGRVVAETMRCPISKTYLALLSDDPPYSNDPVAMMMASEYKRQL